MRREEGVPPETRSSVTVARGMGAPAGSMTATSTRAPLWAARREQKRKETADNRIRITATLIIYLTTVNVKFHPKSAACEIEIPV